jgi:nitroreductase
MNPVLEVIHNRRSVRNYAERPITSAVKDQVLQTTLRAPTAGNMILYSIIDIEDQELKDKLSITCDHQPFIARAPWVLLFAADYQRWWDYYQHCQVKEFCEEKGLAYRTPQMGDMLLAACDALIAAQTAVLAAESLGIGSCYIGDILENYEIHRELLSLPDYVLPITMVCFGYPNKTDKPLRKTTRFDLEFIHFKNGYKRLDGEELSRMFQPLEDLRAREGWPLNGTKNIGQNNYQRKFIADFSIEMNRSVKAMLENWKKK